MTSPSLELQTVICSRLNASPVVFELVGQRVYDHVPRGSGG